MVTPAAAPQATVKATRRIRRYCIVPKPPFPFDVAFATSLRSASLSTVNYSLDRTKADVRAVIQTSADHAHPEVLWVEQLTMR